MAELDNYKIVSRSRLSKLLNIDRMFQKIVASPSHPQSLILLTEKHTSCDVRVRSTILLMIKVKHTKGGEETHNFVQMHKKIQRDLSYIVALTSPISHPLPLHY